MPTNAREGGDLADTRTRVNKAVRELIAEKGYAATSIRDIAKAAGISTPTLYHYAESKEQLVASVIAETMAERLADMDEIYRMESTPARKLCAMIRLQLAIHIDGRSIWATDAEAWRRFDPAITRKIVRLRRRYEMLWRDVLDEGISAGEFTIDDPTVAVNSILGICQNVRYWFSPRGRLTRTQVGDEVSRLTLHMLRASEECIADALPQLSVSRE